MTKRPLCLLCLLMILGLIGAELMGIPLITGNPLPATVQKQIFRHPASRIQGQVEQSESTEFSQSVYLKKTYLIYHSKKIPIENVRVFLKKEEELKPGMTVLVKGTLKRVEAPGNPGGFDSRQYYACRHIYYFMKNGIVCQRSRRYSGYRQALVNIKEKCARILEKAAGEDEPVFTAMLLGDKKDLDPELRMSYQTAGIIHILAISGLHISILGMGLYNILKKAGLGIWPAGILSLAVMVNYGILTGGSVSAVRAVTMFLIAMGARISGRIYDMPGGFSVAAMMILAESPAYLKDSGFLLSFGCVLGAGAASGRICALAGARKKWQKAFISSLSISLVTLPVMLEFFGEISLAGLLLNLLVLPSGGIVLASGVAAVFLGFFSLKASSWAVFPGRVLLFLYKGLCRQAGKSVCSTWIGGKPKLWQIVLYYGILIIVLFMGQYTEKKLRGKGAGTQSERKRFRRLRAGAAVLLAAGIFLLGWRPSGRLKVICLDVGQGDGILIETPERRHFLVDGGSSSQQELGRYCLLPALKSQGISYLDGIFISHTDQDHISGVMELLEYMEKGLTTIRAGTLILPDWEEKPEAWKELAALAEKAGVRTVKGKKGDVLKAGKTVFTILWPEEGAEGKDVNEEAMIMELSLDRFQMLFTGDIGAETEKKLLSAGCLEAVDCLKVGHHGSRYSTSEEFLKKLRPEIAVISCSATNTYGHPSPETIRRLKAAGCQVEYTMKSGAVTITTDGKKAGIRPFCTR